MMFKLADVNQDGKVSIKEIPEPRRPRFARLLARADIDGDKALSTAEAKRVVAAVASRAQAGARRPWAAARPAAYRPQPKPLKQASAKKATQAKEKASRKQAAKAKKKAAKKKAAKAKKKAEAEK